ncbi:MAG: hypothetical protein NC413_09840 [Muribaculum sp.]|nr:hypothetical protein [Muribaculum sp.]
MNSGCALLDIKPPMRKEQGRKGDIMDTELVFWIGRGSLCVSVVTATTFGLLRLGALDEEWSLRLDVGGRRIVCALCLVSALCIMLVGAESVWEEVLLGVLGGCLLTASIMDWWEQLVYRFIWWIGGVTGGVLLVRAGMSQQIICSIIGFWLLQRLLFARMYGRADCYAFCVSALAMAALGGGFADYVTHMFLVFVGLTAVQMAHGNISKDGNLKKAVPLVPYITIAFWLWVAFGLGKWYIIGSM